MMQPERAQNAEQDDWSPRLLRPSLKKLRVPPQQTKKCIFFDKFHLFLLFVMLITL
jgi:hypothetical protein